MKRIQVAFEAAPGRVIMGDQIELDGDGGVKIVANGQMVAHLKSYYSVAFEDSLAPRREEDKP